MSPYTIDTIPMIERIEPSGSSWASSGSRDFGSRNHPATNAAVTMGMFTRNTEPYQKWVRRKPLATGPDQPGASRDGRPRGDRFGALVGREDVHEDRQRRRHDERGTDAHQASTRDQLPRAVRERGADARDQEHDESELERALAAESVADRAGGEEQAREHERVRGDDPLQL
jgi:hypothetical protein